MQRPRFKRHRDDGRWRNPINSTTEAATSNMFFLFLHSGRPFVSTRFSLPKPGGRNSLIVPPPPLHYLVIRSGPHPHRGTLKAHARACPQESRRTRTHHLIPVTHQPASKCHRPCAYNSPERGRGATPPSTVAIGPERQHRSMKSD